jgi:uracil-DNA glycosylase
LPQLLDQSLNSLAGLMAWYRAMGVDAAVGDVALEWTERAEGPGAEYRLPQRQPTESPVETAPRTGHATAVASLTSKPPLPGRPPIVVNTPPPRQFSPKSPDATVTEARTLADGAQSLDALVQVLRAFDGCGLKTTAMNLCVYRGAQIAQLMIIGEAPGREEDLEGKPFVGPPGQLLDRMLAAAGLQPDMLHIANAVYWRPPGNRAPTPEETEICRPFLERQIALVKPDLILVLGGTAAKSVLSVSEGITRARGQWHNLEIGGRTVRAMASLHPAYLLRTPAAKRQAWRDILTIREALG